MLCSMIHKWKRPVSQRKSADKGDTSKQPAEKKEKCKHSQYAKKGEGRTCKKK